MDNNKKLSGDTEEDNFLLPSGLGQNNFSVPQDYFDFLPEQIMNRVHPESQHKNLFFLLKPIVAIPSLAVVSGIIALLFFFQKEIVPATEILLSENEIQQVIDDPETYNIDEASITEQYLLTNISDEPVNEGSTASDEEITSYLEDNSDVTTIIN